MLDWNAPCSNTFTTGKDMVGAIKLVDSVREPLVDSALGDYRLYACSDCWRGSRYHGYLPKSTIAERIYRLRMNKFRGIGDDIEEDNDDIKGEATPDKAQKDLQPVAGPSKTQAEKRKQMECKTTPAAKVSKEDYTNSMAKKELFKEGETSEED